MSIDKTKQLGKSVIQKKNHKVLLVESSTTQATIITRYLNELGFAHNRHSLSGRKAIEICAEFEPNIILSALHLNDIRADEMAAKLFHQEECENLVFILISSEKKQDALEPIRQSGIHTILPKPFQKVDLRKTLSQAIEYLELRDSISQWLPKDFSVLITDDSSMSRKYISNTLNKLGIYNIFEAANVDSAIHIMDKNVVSLIISDYQMPQRTGMNFLEYIRKKSLQPGIPFLLVSANINHHIIKQAYEQGITNILAKPFSFYEFKKILLKIIKDCSHE